LRFDGAGFHDKASGFGEFGIFESDRHFGEAHRRALDGAVKNAIAHTAGAQGLVALFAEDPADGIHHVGFAATIWPDDAGRSGAAERNHGAFTERLESRDFHFAEF
jgi:hypothetical protein